MTKTTALAVVSAAALGCSTPSRQINLLYGANAAVSPGAAASAGSSRIAVALFTDARDPDDGAGRFLGSIRTIYGRPNTSVYALQDPVLWVSEGIVRGLATRGYTVERVTSSRTAADLPTVTGKVTKVLSSMYVNVEAHVEADVTLEHSGQQIATVRCSGATLRSAGSATAILYQDVFLETMTLFVADCIPKLVTLLESRSQP
jgi:hypothetical protein